MEQILIQLNNMDMFNKNPNNPEFYYYKKLFVYSAHDTNMLIMLDNLGLVERECLYEEFLSGQPQSESKCKISFPKFASNVVFENHFNKAKRETYIAVRYNGIYLKMCPEEQII
jgi:hypothetical protein